MANAVLVLEDGSAWHGEPFGADVPATGEVVFNTAMTGYQEIATDASYNGQMVVLTHPQIGNYGVSASAEESERPWIRALIVRDLSPTYHHWEARESLDAYLRRHGIPGITGIDTRALVKRLRARGALRAVLRQQPGPWSVEQVARLVEEAREVTPLSEQPLVAESSGYVAAFGSGGSAEGPRLVVVDCGAKANIVRSLAHPDGGRCDRCAQSEPVKSGDDDLVMGALSAADARWPKHLVRALSDTATFGILLR